MKLGFGWGALAFAGLGCGLAFVAATLIWLREPGPPVTFWITVASGLLGVGAFISLRRALLEAEQVHESSNKRADELEEAMRRHRHAIDALAGGLKSAIFVCDSKAQILYANSRAKEMFRFEESSGRSILAATIDYDLEQIVLEAARGADPIERELPLAFPEDRTVIARAWREPEGDRVFVSLYEITELRRLERVRQDFVANVSHELRTPLAAIRSLAETLEDEPRAAPAKRADYLHRIVAEVDRLAVIVSDLLILSTAESGPVSRKPCDIAAVIREAVALLRPKAEAKGLELLENLSEPLKPLANPDQISQVAINLIDNAINYTLEGRVSVSLTLEGSQAVLSIEDTGIGIASEELPRIFERFYRVDKGRSRATGGTGLGLSIVRHIVESHGGQVDVQSALHEGSKFTVRLPLSA